MTCRGLRVHVHTPNTTTRADTRTCISTLTYLSILVPSYTHTYMPTYLQAYELAYLQLLARNCKMRAYEKQETIRALRVKKRSSAGPLGLALPGLAAGLAGLLGRRPAGEVGEPGYPAGCLVAARVLEGPLPGLPQHPLYLLLVG